MLGKLITHEFAFGIQFPGHRFPAARNPWDLERMPGGSSSGSGAALAAGMAFGALGTDTGGSIRGPASLCGIAGLKPTYGRCSRAGVLTLSWTLDHTGPMARTVEDCAYLLQALAGYDAADPASSPQPQAPAHVRHGLRSRLRIPPRQHRAVQHDRAARAGGAVRLHRGGPADLDPDRRASVRRDHRAARGAHLRAGHRLAQTPPECLIPWGASKGLARQEQR